MTESAKNAHARFVRHVMLASGSCLILISGLVAVQIARADGRILPNVSIAGINVGNLTPDQAKERLQNALRAMNVAGFTFSFQDRAVTLHANERLPGDDQGPIVYYDIDGMVQKAFSFGHDGGVSDLALANARALFTEVMLPTQASLDKARLRKLLVGRFGPLEHPAHDADVAISKTVTYPPPGDASATPQTSYVVEIVPETSGNSFDYDAAINQTAEALPRWQGSDALLALHQETPVITTETADGLRGDVQKILDRGEVDLAYDDKTWTIGPDALMNALTLKTGPAGTPIVGIRPSAIETLLADAAAIIEIEPKPTHLVVDDTWRATEFEGGQVGKNIDRDATVAAIDAHLEDADIPAIPIVVDNIYAKDSDPIAEDLGIRELVGYGTSNMAGSPKNRRKNIANGAKLLNGVIIKPGEEFSLLEHLRPFTEENGYYKELIIKGDRTVPDVGGGLCQIGTTTFRAAMGSGLPITQRQNHSYRVRYYEPAGTDATIFSPAPDFRFINDTGNHLLMTTNIDGDKLRFEFWGTRDGRIEKQSAVKIWNITQPPAPKLIETSTLADGKQKCFEIAHPGATTDFTYTIVYPDGTVKNKDFKSFYKPWQEQCLVGKADAPRIIIDKDGGIKELPPPPPPATPAQNPS